jgi:hypothetical protein
VIFAGLAAAGTAVGTSWSNDTPSSNTSGAQVIAFYEAHRSGQRTGDILVALAFVFFLFFVGSLRAHLRQARAAEPLSAVMLAGAVVFTIGMTLLAGLDFALADVPHDLSAAAAQALNVLNNDLVFPSLVGLAVFGLASGLAILRGAPLPRWLGWVAIAIGIAAVTPATPLARLAIAIWTIIVSVLICLRSDAGVAAASVGAVEPRA